MKFMDHGFGHQQWQSPLQDRRRRRLNHTLRDYCVVWILMLTVAAGEAGAAIPGAAHTPLPGSASPALPGVIAIPSEVSFLAATVGTADSQTVMLTNSGQANFLISRVRVEGNGFRVTGLTSPAILPPGGNLTFNVEFAPRAAANVRGSILFFSDSGALALVLPLSGTASARVRALTVTARALDFGSVRPGTITPAEPVRLTNTGNSDLTITQSLLRGAGFSMDAPPLPMTLSPGQDVSFYITFSPRVRGDARGTLLISTDATGQPEAVHLFGTGRNLESKLSAEPKDLEFGSNQNGYTATRDLDLFNLGDVAITMSNVAISSAVFGVNGVEFPFTIAPGDKAVIHVTYTPTDSVLDSGNLSIITDSPDSPLTISLAGSGSNGDKNSVISISWAGNDSPSIAGYNIYRADTPDGSFIQLNSSPIVEPSFQDSDVESGATYFYVTTAVDAAGHESSFSNEVAAAAP